VKTILLDLLKGIGLKIGGVASWLLGFLVDYIYNKAVIVIQNARLESEIKKQDALLYETYRIAVASGNLSREDRRDLALRLLNRAP
jgi:hypothetical protein